MQTSEGSQQFASLDAGLMSLQRKLYAIQFISFGLAMN